MFFLQEWGVRLGLVVEGEGGRLGLALDDLSTTTHPLQYRSSESVYDYTSPSVAEFRARQARTRRY